MNVIDLVLMGGFNFRMGGAKKTLLQYDRTPWWNYHRYGEFI